MDEEKKTLIFQDVDDPERKIILTCHPPSTDEWFKFRARLHLTIMGTEKGTEERLEKLYRLNFDSGISVLESFSDPMDITGIAPDGPTWKEALGRKFPDLVIEAGFAVFQRKEYILEKNS